MALCLPMRAGIHTYADQSVLTTGHWVKIRVSESGVCRMSFDELRTAGIDPSRVRVFGYGGAMLQQNFQKAKIDDLPQVPVFVGTDYVLFYVQGPISWSYDTAKGRFTHTRNTYSDYGYYFLSDDAGTPLAPVIGDAISGTPTDVRSYSMLQVQDKDSINLVDRTGLSGGGRTFYGEQFSPGRSRTFRFAVPDALTDENATAFIDMAAYASTISTFSAVLNNSATRTASIDAATGNYTFGVVKTLTLTGSAAVNQTVQLSFQNSSASALGWLNYIEITTPRALNMIGSYMPVRTLVNRNSSVPVRFHLTGADENVQIWDVTNLADITRMPTTTENDEVLWTGTQSNGIHEYIAVNTAASTGFVSAEVVGNVVNQNLHQLNNIDYVIICPEGYEAQSTRLAKAHEAKEAITWTVVTDQQVYNEFSSGTPDATAYRWLMKMLYDRANNGNGEKPRWLLLMGHGTFDNRKLLSNSGTSLLLTYQSKNSVDEVQAYTTDDYFGFLDDNEGESDESGRMDIGVGRLPVESVAEATTTVDKLIAYINNTHRGKWKNQFLYLADDGEHGKHTTTAEESAELVRLKNLDFVVHKVYLDAYPQEVNASGESYPLAKNRVLNLLRNGVLFFNYSGHGGYNAITNESIMNLKDIESMVNKNQAFWLFVTCNFAQFDGGRRSAAEAAVLNPKGGAIGILSATRTVYADQNTKLNRMVSDTLFGHYNTFHYDMTLGEAVAAGKNKTGTQTNKLAYVLLGDPAMHLNFPTEYHVETITEVDTLNALSVQHIEGRIIDEDSLTVDFNGKVDITIYDKMQVITTRDNDDTSGDAQLLSYNDYPNTLFSGTTEVKDGLFNYTFMVPKDIRYNFGNGRIVYYAATADSLDDKMEAVGYFEDFVVGGTGSIFSTDTVGPEMTIYLNSPAFQNGGKTYPTPRFYAELEDPHGINTAGAGIGHDLMLIIDDDPSKIYSLNEYFTAEDNSYTSGRVSYLMEAQSEGMHSLSFRAWDLLNNSTTKTLNFIVQAGLDPSIYNVMTYPNPVKQTGVLNLVVNYDQPDEALSTEVYLFNTSGQMIYTHKQDNPDQVSINLHEMELMPGVYMYSVKIKSASSRYSAASGKIIVTK